MVIFQKNLTSYENATCQNWNFVHGYTGFVLSFIRLVPHNQNCISYLRAEISRECTTVLLITAVTLHIEKRVFKSLA